MAETNTQFTRNPDSTRDGIPVFAEDKYWGKVPEAELEIALKTIDEGGFEKFDKKLRKRLDFSFDEDRADWRFMMPLSSDAVALDIGAGLGRISIPLARVTGKVYACDRSLSRMRFLNRRAKNEGLENIVSFVGDIYDLPLLENSFDLIVMNGVLEWVGLTDKYANPREAQIQALKICRKLLKPGGRLYIGIENRLAMAYLKTPDHGGLLYTNFMPRKVADAYARLRKKGSYRTYTYTKPGYEKLLVDAGFVSPKIDFYLVHPGYNLPRILFRYDDIRALRFLLTSFKPSSSTLRRIAMKVAAFGPIIRAYRLVFYSFGIFAQK